MRANPQNISLIIPPKLYKYYSINDYLYEVIKSSSCWFSRPSDFNDPFDCNLDVVALCRFAQGHLFGV